MFEPLSLERARGEADLASSPAAPLAKDMQDRYRGVPLGVESAWPGLFGPSPLARNS